MGYDIELYALEEVAAQADSNGMLPDPIKNIRPSAENYLSYNFTRIPEMARIWCFRDDALGQITNDVISEVQPSQPFGILGSYPMLARR